MHLIRFARGLEPKGDHVIALAAVGVAVAALAIALNFAFFTTRDAPPPGTAATTEISGAAVPSPPVPPKTSAGKTSTGAPTPSFDIVRIGPTGDAVLAGRTVANGTVEILADDAVIGRVSADGRGEWVFVPEQPLSPGPHRISVRAASDAGAPAVQGATTVVTIPAPPR